MTPDPRSLIEPFVPLEAVDATAELSRRTARQADLVAESGALLQLAEGMTHAPGQVTQHLVDIALRLCRAGSAGLSIIEEEDGRAIFRWRALAGSLAGHLLGTTPREFSPCGTVIDRNAIMLMSKMDLHYRYFAEVQPRVFEVLLVPFHAANRPVGTVWVVNHDETAQFDAEDARVMSDLAAFAAAAFGLWELHLSGAAKDGVGKRAWDLTDTYAVMRLVAEQLQRQLSEQRSADKGPGAQQAHADLGRLIFLIDGLLHRQKTVKEGTPVEHRQAQSETHPEHSS